MPKFSSQELFFLSLVRSGLWGGEPAYPVTSDGDFVPDRKVISKLAEAQTVVGLVGEGMGSLPQKTATEEWNLRQEALQPMIVQAYRTERRNAEMDAFLAKLMTKLREEGIIALVVKGQAVGHLYANPSVRQAGDIDLFLD